MVMGPAQIVDPIVGQASRGGLLSSVEVIEGGKATEDRRWENGYTWRPLGGCGEAGFWAPCSGDTKPIDPSGPIVEVVPGTVYAGFKCSSWALTEEERIAHAETALYSMGGKQVEAELWTGAAAQAEGWPNPYLASPATVKLTVGTETSALIYAFASLVAAMRECQGDIAGVIHATAATVLLWKAARIIEIETRQINGIEQDVLVDAFGNIVIGGAGYDGSSPDGTIDPSGRTAWAYATGPVEVRVGPTYIVPDNTAEALDRKTNDIEWRAERTAAAAFDPCCLYGINVDLCGTSCSSGS